MDPSLFTGSDPAVGSPPSGLRLRISTLSGRSSRSLYTKGSLGSCFGSPRPYVPSRPGERGTGDVQRLVSSR